MRLEGTLGGILWVTSTATLGIWGLATASEGWLNGRMGVISRVLLAASALCLVAGDLYTHIIGFGVGGAIVALRMLPFSRTAFALAAPTTALHASIRSEERRVWQECLSTCR